MAQIPVGGAFGIACILLATPIVGALVPLIGLEFATLAYVLAIVVAIVAFGEMAPLLFNNYAFMYLTVIGGETGLSAFFTESSRGKPHTRAKPLN